MPSLLVVEDEPHIASGLRFNLEAEGYEVEVVDEARIECVLARAARPRVVAALLAAHPYEEPAYDVVELADPGVAATGSGRIGSVAETTLSGFAQTVADGLPRTATGVRVGGHPDRAVRRVAVCGGAGDFLLAPVFGESGNLSG